MSKVVLSKSSFPPICGNGARLFHIITRFKDNSKVLVYSSPYSNTDVTEGNYDKVEVKKIHTGLKDLFKTNESISKLNNNDKLVIYAMQPNLLLLLPSIKKAKKKGVKIIFDVEDMPTYAENPPYKSFNFYIKKKYAEILNIADKIICISKYLKNEIVSDFNIERDKIEVIHNGVDMSFFQRDAEKGKSLREKYNLEDDDIVFIYSGAIVDWSGAITCLNTFKKAIDQNPKIKVLYIGNGDIEDLENKIKELKLEKNAQYLGFFDFEEVPGLLSIGDVGLLPFEKNPLTEAASPIKIFEYMSTGMPVISTDIRGTKEVIEDGYNGILVKDDAEFVSAIIKISEDKDFYEKLKENSFETVKMYDWDFLAKRFEDIVNNA